MNWKNDIIRSAAEAEKFLCSQLGRMNIAPLKIEADHRCGLAFFAETIIDGEPQRIISFEIETKHGILWRNLNTGYGFRGKGLSLMAVKCAIGVAHEKATSTITLFQICNDGPGFWPTMGAVPTSAPCLIGDHVEAVLDDKRQEIDACFMPTIEQTIGLATKDPYAAWRKLSQTDIRLKNGMQFKHEVITRMCAGSNLEFRLGDLSTQRILHQRIGNMPEFASSSDRPKFIRIGSHRQIETMAP